jgi:hypothetical protein
MVLQVQLNGDRPATHACLAQFPDEQRTESSAQAPSPQLTSCQSWTSVELFVDTNYGGARLCIGGTGTMNLDYYTYYEWWGPARVPRSWNDKLSSFKTGSQYVNFYEHKNLGGQRLRYASNQSRASMPSGWNDRVSSVCLWSAGNSCP